MLAGAKICVCAVVDTHVPHWSACHDTGGWPLLYSGCGRVPQAFGGVPHPCGFQGAGFDFNSESLKHGDVSESFCLKLWLSSRSGHPALGKLSASVLSFSLSDF
jgi:hypothetical protein